jgi:adenine nucleotide transporter 17
MNSRGVVLLRSCLAVAPVIACLLSLSHRNSSRGGGGVARLIDGGEDVVHAVSGAVGSALSITLLYPLETVRTRLQVGACRSSGTENDNARRSSFRLVRDIGEAEGLVGLYRGWSSLVVALMALNFVYFYCFRSTRRWIVNMSDWGGSDGDEGGGGSINVDLVAGYLAGVIAVLVTGPLWLGECFTAILLP